MRGQRLWTIAIAVLIIMAATKYVSAQVETRAMPQLTGDNEDNTLTFRVRIQNKSGDSDLPTLFAPGVWVLHSGGSPLFASSEAGRGDGLKALAEEGDPAALADALRAQGFLAGFFDTPVCADGPGPLPSGSEEEFGNTYEFEVTASPDSPYLSFATMLVQSNDLFLVSGENGIVLFDEDGSAIGVQNVTDKLLLWEAGTEANGESGDGGFGYPNVADLVDVSISSDLMVSREKGRQLPPPADHQIGQIFQVGDVQWQVHSAQILGDKLIAKKEMLTTDERFVLVRFSFLNLGSDPLEFDGGPRNRKGVSLRDDQGREHTYYLEPRIGMPDNPPHDYVPEDENCYGRWRIGGWRPFELKPNSPTTCSIIYEVNADATTLVFVASELGKDQVGAIETVDLKLSSAVSPHSIGENVSVGIVRWNVFGAEDYGQVLRAEDGTLKTKNRFIQVRFYVQNKGSESLRFDVVDDVKLRDSLGRDHGHYLVPRRMRPDRYPEEVIPDDEECRNYELKPNMSATCTAIYEVDEKTTGLVLVAGHLGGTESGIELIDLGLPSRKAVSIYSVNDDVEVGDMCWRVLSAKNLGKVLKSNGDEERAEGRFIGVRFRILNLGSETLELDHADAVLVDERNRSYFHHHVVRDLWPDRHPVESIPDNEECYHIDLKPNIPTTCTMIYDVADDSENAFIFVSGDLEGYETGLVVLSPEIVDPCTVERRPISVGKHEVCEAVSPGIYRGEGSEESPCLWARHDSSEADFDSVIATRTHEGQFYVEILDSDAAFSTDCDLEPIENVPPPDPLPTLFPPGMYLVDRDIGPRSVRGCTFSRLVLLLAAVELRHRRRTLCSGLGPGGRKIPSRGLRKRFSCRVCLPGREGSTRLSTDL